MIKARRDSIYYFIRDILHDCFFKNSNTNLASVLNRHLITKNSVRDVFKDEVKESKPKFKVLQNSLIVLNNYLRILPTSAFYEVVENLPELKYCLKKDKRITVIKLSAQTIFRLFITIYYETIFLPLGNRDKDEFVSIFTKYFSKSDMLQIIEICGFHTHFILDQHGLDMGFGEDKKEKLKRIVDQFYK